MAVANAQRTHLSLVRESSGGNPEVKDRIDNIKKLALQARSWAVFRLTRWKAPTPPACHLARSGRNPDVRLLAGGLPMSEAAAVKALVLSFDPPPEPAA